MKFNHSLLFILSEQLRAGSPSLQVLQQIQAALAERAFKTDVTYCLEDGARLIERSAQYSAVGVYWDSTNTALGSELSDFIDIFRRRNAATPLIIFSEENITALVPLSVLKEVSEYVYLFSESVPFTANRIDSLVRRYAKNRLPPYFKALKEFTEDGDYYWDCPGHMGGMAYLKHPVGVEFINFFGENMMRADIGVATAGMGDYLMHAGPPKKSEEIAARLFGADWTFYGVSGSSGSNRIVVQAAVGANEIVIVDRNCHKSLNHGLTLSQARPVYLKPARNAWGLIGPIPTERFSKSNIDALIANSDLSSGAVSPLPACAVVTNCTYDGFCYNVNDVIGPLGESAPRIHFDEAWFAYARFHPLYRGRYAMDADKTPNRPTLFAVQSTHKMLPSLSMASMIHVKKSPRAPLDFDDFNDAFMMHGTTSPFYPIIASIDVAVSMMAGESGYSLVQESIEEAIAFRKAVVGIKQQIQAQEDKDGWFFAVLQPDKVVDTDSGQHYSFVEAPVSLLSHSASCWTLRAGERWHGFADEDLVGTDSMLDPVKVTLTCPGIDINGNKENRGIPGCVLTRFLDDRRIEVARTGDYSVLILFSVGTTKGKWGTLIESLLAFKKYYDSDGLAVDAISSLKAQSPRYDSMTLKQLCQSMHEKMDELDLMWHIREAVNAAPEPVMTPADAYQNVVRYRAEHIRLDDFSGRIAASMVVPYPPGIPLLIPGERMPADNRGIIGYLLALQAFDNAFPGFEHEIQGVNVDENGDFWVRAIVEDDRKANDLPGHISFRRRASGIKKGRH